MERAADFGSLWELLVVRAAAGQCRYICYDARTGRERQLASGQLATAAADAGSGLLAWCTSRSGHRSRAQVLIATPDPLCFIVLFFSVVRAGLVPIPAASHPLEHRRHLRRLRALVATVDPLAVVTDQGSVDPLTRELSPGVPVAGLDDLRAACPAGPSFPPVSSVAYVQYTSGSQTDPKPVSLGHEHVLAQLDQAAEAFGETGASVSVGWTPLYHDMGLVTGVLRPLWSGYTSVLVDPFDFVRDPALWPRMMSRWRATHTCAPDFGYSLCARKAGDTDQLDLGCVKVARSAGEPVRARTLRAFAERFRPAGFDLAAFKPSYGLAEATLTVTTTALSRPPSWLRLSRHELGQGLVRTTSGPEAVEVVSCGTPLRRTEVAVLDGGPGEAVGEDELGEVWVSGPQVAPSADSIWTLQGRRVGHRTGDIGFLHGGELYLIGRGSERFQVAGENFYSGELEAIASTADPRLRPGRAAVFLGQLRHWPEPAPVVVAECRSGVADDSGTYSGMAKAMTAAVGHRAGLPVDCVWLVRPGSLEVTTSGKLQRERCREAFEKGTIETLYRHERTAP